MSDEKTYWDYIETVTICNLEECGAILRGNNHYSDAVEHVMTQHFSHCLCCETKCEGIIMPEGYCCVQGGRKKYELCDYCKDRENRITEVFLI